MNIQNTAAWVAVVGFLGGGLWMIFQYDQRIRTLETRVNLLLGASPSGHTEDASSSGDGVPTAQNPSSQFKDVCEALALRRADAIEAGRVLVDARELQKLMLELQCITEN